VLYFCVTNQHKLRQRHAHVIASPRLWLVAQTADTASDWLEQLKRFTAGAFCLG